MKMNVYQIIEIIIACVGFIVSGISWIRYFIMCDKQKKINILKETTLGLIEDAEKFSSYSGEEKKQFVLTRAKDFIQSHKLKITDNQLSVMIDRFVEMSNNVNVKKVTKK